MDRTAAAPGTEPDGVGAVWALFARSGGQRYGEDVTQEEHARQTAACAEADGAAPDLVVAALLHDVGHLLEAARDDTGDPAHDRRGAAWLAAQGFPPAVTRPVALHVAAKRWLCAADPAYAARLSAASTATLALQGGPFDAAGSARFLALPGAAEAVRLRRWDDEGKVVGRAVPPLDHFRPLVAGALR